MDKFTSEFTLLTNAIKRNSNVIAQNLPKESQLAIIEQERIIEDATNKLEIARKKSKHIIESLITV